MDGLVIPSRTAIPVLLVLLVAVVLSSTTISSSSSSPTGQLVAIAESQRECPSGGKYSSGIAIGYGLSLDEDLAPLNAVVDCEKKQVEYRKRVESTIQEKVLECVANPNCQATVTRENLLDDCGAATCTSFNWDGVRHWACISVDGSDSAVITCQPRPI